MSNGFPSNPQPGEVYPPTGSPQWRWVPPTWLPVGSGGGGGGNGGDVIVNPPFDPVAWGAINQDGSRAMTAPLTLLAQAQADNQATTRAQVAQMVAGGPPGTVIVANGSVAMTGPLTLAQGQATGFQAVSADQVTAMINALPEPNLDPFLRRDGSLSMTGPLLLAGPGAGNQAATAAQVAAVQAAIPDVSGFLTQTAADQRYAPIAQGGWISNANTQVTGPNIYGLRSDGGGVLTWVQVPTAGDQPPITLPSWVSGAGNPAAGIWGLQRNDLTWQLINIPNTANFINTTGGQTIAGNLNVNGTLFAGTLSTQGVANVITWAQGQFATQAWVNNWANNIPSLVNALNDRLWIGGGTVTGPLTLQAAGTPVPPSIIPGCINVSAGIRFYGAAYGGWGKRFRFGWTDRAVISIVDESYVGSLILSPDDTIIRMRIHPTGQLQITNGASSWGINTTFIANTTF